MPIPTPKPSSEDNSWASTFYNMANATVNLVGSALDTVAKRAWYNRNGIMLTLTALMAAETVVTTGDIELSDIRLISFLQDNVKDTITFCFDSVEGGAEQAFKVMTKGSEGASVVMGQLNRLDPETCSSSGDSMNDAQIYKCLIGMVRKGVTFITTAGDSAPAIEEVDPSTACTM